MRIAKYVIVASLALMTAGAFAQTVNPVKKAGLVPLSFPTEVDITLNSSNSVQMLSFTGTNLTDHAVKIVGYGASCGCTTVDSKGPVIPANGKMEYRVKITRKAPATEYATIVDEQTNLYVVVFKVKPLATSPETETNKPNTK